MFALSGPLRRSVAAASVLGAGSVPIVSNGVLAPFVTFTRASTASRYNSAGLLETVAANQPRIDYDPATVTRANLLTFSEQLDNAAWGKQQATITPNSTVAPDGTVSGDLVTSTTTAGVAYVQRPITFAASTYTASFFVKAAGSSYCAVRVQDGANYPEVRFYLQDGSASVSQGSPVAYGAAPVGNGWWRCWVTTAAAATTGWAGVYVYAANGSRAYTAAGESLFVWGGQVEAGATATDYIPTGASPAGDAELRGLLVEEQRTNLLLRSQEFDNAVVWILSGADRISNATVAPDGTLTAEKLVETAVNAPHSVTQNVSLVSGTTYAFSFYAKAAERTVVSFFGAGGLSSIAGRVNLTTGAVESGTVSVQNVGNGWWRISAVGASTFTGANSVSIQLYSVGGTYLGDGTSGVFLWGAQVEAGAFTTSYIPTVATAQTRAADAASVTGQNFASWYNASEGTFVAHYSANNDISVNRAPFAASDGTNNNRIHIYQSTPISFNVATGGVVQGIPGNYTTTDFGNIRVALAYKANSLQGGYFGNVTAEDTVATIPTVDRLFIGAAATGNSGYLNGAIRQIRYYPRRLSDAQLQALTA